MENQRKLELFDLLKSRLEDEFYKQAERLSETDEQAQEEINKLNSWNSDVGGGCGFDDLPEHIQDRLIEEAREQSYIMNVDYYESAGVCIVEILNKILEI